MQLPWCPCFIKSFRFLFWCFNLCVFEDWGSSFLCLSLCSTAFFLIFILCFYWGQTQCFHVKWYLESTKDRVLLPLGVPFCQAGTPPTVDLFTAGVHAAGGKPGVSPLPQSVTLSDAVSEPLELFSEQRGRTHSLPSLSLSTHTSETFLGMLLPFWSPPRCGSLYGISHHQHFRL